MAEIPPVYVEFRGNVEKLMEAFKKIEGEYKIIQHETNATSKATGEMSARAVAMGTVMAAALQHIGREVLKFGKEFVTTYQDIGKEVRGLQRVLGGSAEDISRLRFAAHEVGIEASTLARSMRILSVHIEKNDKGAQKLGIAFRTSTGEMRPTIDVMADLADRFASMPPGLERTALAVQAFGRSGTEMLPLLALGGERFRELATEADKLGLTLSGKDLEAVKDYTMKQRELHASIQGVQIVIGRDLMPVLTKLTTYATTTVVPAIKAFAEGLMGKGGITEGMTKSDKAAQAWGLRIRTLVGYLKTFHTELLIVGATLAFVWTTTKVIAGVSATIAAIRALVAAYNLLKTSALVAGVAEAFALNPVLGIAAATLGIAAFAGVVSKAKSFDIGLPSAAGISTADQSSWDSGLQAAIEKAKALANQNLNDNKNTTDDATTSAKNHAAAQKKVAEAAKASADEIARLNLEMARLNSMFTASNSWLAAQTRTAGPQRGNFGGFVEVPVIIDGQVVFRATQKFSLLNDMRNPTNGLSLSGSLI